MRITKKSFRLLPCLVLFAGLSSCASLPDITDTLSEIAKVAVETGDEEAAAIANVASSLTKAVEEITPENEYYIGRSVAASITNTYPVYENQKQEHYLNLILQTLIYNSDVQNTYNGYHVKILNTPEVNAFTTSAGHIFITKGLINCAQSEDEIAAAIAHEISHVQLKHGTNVIRASRFADVGTAAASAYLTFQDESELAQAMDGCVGDVINQLVTKGYSKEQEFQADSNALTLMNNAGYNPNAMIVLLQHMADSSGDKAGGMFKTHPSPNDRINNVNKAMKSIKNISDTSEYRKARFTKNMK